MTPPAALAHEAAGHDMGPEEFQMRRGALGGEAVAPQSHPAAEAIGSTVAGRHLRLVSSNGLVVEPSRYQNAQVHIPEATPKGIEEAVARVGLLA